MFSFLTVLLVNNLFVSCIVNPSQESSSNTPFAELLTNSNGKQFLRLVTDGILKTPDFETKRDELLYWANQQGNQHLINTHLAEIAACVMVKDEHLDILEWIAYHKHIGVGKFYIYDNNSVPPMIGMLRPHLSHGLIDYQYLNDTFVVDDYLIHKKMQEFKSGYRSRLTTELINSVQVWSMTTCVRTYAERHKWVVLIDVDEFLVFEQVQQHPSLSLFLREYDEYGGVAVYRRTFGSSGFVGRPPAGVLASYTSCTEHLRSDIRQAYPKIILNTEFFKWPDGECRVHECSTIRSLVNTNKQPLSVRWFMSSRTATWDKLRVHHYAVKSYEDFQIKQQRGMPHSRSNPRSHTTSRSWAFFNDTDWRADFECYEATPYASQCCKKSITYSQLIHRKLQQIPQSAYYYHAS